MYNVTNICLLKNYFQLEDDWFTTLCWFLLYDSVHQLYVYSHPLLLEPHHPTPLGRHSAPR